MNRGARANRRGDGLDGRHERVEVSLTDVADGFNINIDVQPDGVARFKDVITELQNRGRYRKEYEYKTFRANYGLPSSETGQ